MIDLNQLNPYIWVGAAAALLLIAFLQLIYIFILTATSGVRDEKPIQPPDTPIMPTKPAGGVETSGAPAPMRSNLMRMVIIGGLPKDEKPLPEGNFVIGRFYNPDQKVMIAFDEKSISRRHAVFHFEESTQQYYLTDARSSYGTYLKKGNNFESLKPDAQERIFNEDEVQFGNVVRVRFVLPGTTRAASR